MAEFGLRVAAVVLGPLLLYQGWATRRRVPRLSEPPGSREGTRGAGPSLRLLIVGDSAAAGVGAGHQDEALLGHVTARLAEGYAVRWALRARTGATTASTLRHLRVSEPETFDVALTALGVNDVVSGVSRARWLRDQAELRAELTSRFGVRHLVVCGLPPVHGFPGLPQPLRWYLGSRAKQFTRDLQGGVQDDPRVRFLPIDFTQDATLMASDGYHPGPAIYEMWGLRAAEIIKNVVAAQAGNPDSTP